MKKALLLIALVAFVASTTISAQDKAAKTAKTEKAAGKDCKKACCSKDKADKK